MKKIGYFILVLLVIAAVAEIGFRISGAYKTYSEKTTGKFYTDLGKESQNRLKNYPPNSRFIIDHGEFKYTYHTNGFGFREREVPIETGDRSKVFVFGDSFTDGVGAAADSTWPRFMEKLLARDLGTDGVYTFATSGSDPFYNYMTLSSMVRLEPTHVIFVINETDLNDYYIRGGFERYTKDGAVKFRDPPSFLPLYRSSHLARFIFIELMGYNHNLVRTKDLDGHRRKAALDIAECLHMASKLCWEYNTKFMVVSHPMPMPICMGSSSADHEVNIFESYIVNIPVIHISDQLTNAMIGESCTSYYWPVDGHFNKKGYELMANVIYEAIGREYPDFFGSTIPKF